MRAPEFPVHIGENDKMEHAAAPLLKVGIVSDIQALPSEHDWGFHNFRNALKLFREKGIDLLINAGDLAEGGDPATYDLYWRLIAEYFPEKLPAHMACEGNHDCNGAKDFPEAFARVCKGLRRACVNPEHRVIGGFDFITFATCDRLHYAESELPALEEELRKAAARDPRKPVFVITHLPPARTMTGSHDAAGSAGLRRIFDKFPQVISLSGHTHVPLADERAVWQGGFTAVETSTLAYGCFTEESCFNTVNGILPFAREVTEALYMELFPDRAELHRYNTTENREVGPVWIIDTPYDAATARYTPDRGGRAQAPGFPPEAEVLLRYDYGYAYIIFDRAAAGDPALFYDVEIAHAGGETKEFGEAQVYRYVSDFYRFECNRKDKIYLKLPGTLRENTLCRFRVYPVEAFGKRGAPLEMTCLLWPGYKFKDGAPVCPQE